MNLMSQSEYARKRNRARSLISRYVKQGRIILVDGKVNTEQADKALGFLNENSVHNVHKNGDRGNASGGDNYWKEKTRREAAEASLKEMELARRRQELVEVEAVDYEFSKLVAAVRQKLLAVPSKIAPLTHNQKTVAATQRIFEQGIHEALNELGNYDAKSGKSRSPRASRTKLNGKH